MENKELGLDNQDIGYTLSGMESLSIPENEATELEVPA